MPVTASHKIGNLLCEENVQKFVLPHYGLEDAALTQIKFKDTDKQRAVYKVQSSNDIYCLKKVYFPTGDLLFVYSAIEWLYRHEIHVPRILPTLEKGRFVNYHDMLFILTPWIVGSKCNYDNEEHLLATSKNLGKMHLECENFTPILGSTPRVGFNNLAHTLNKHFHDMLNYFNLALNHKDPFSKLYLQHFDVNMKLGEISNKASYQINQAHLTSSLCHLDYVNKNIIFDEKNEIWIIDFDKCRMDYCAHDFSYCLRRLLKRENTKWSFEVARKCLESYEEFHTLNLEDHKYILAYLAFPQKYWKITRDYFSNIHKCNKKAFLHLLKKGVDLTEEQLEFILQFKTYIEEKFKCNIEV